mmetsp:Transcript_922/g.2603  ORF Transcript_922/g.2603 Transcript_922/m.2603 type:complete len:378 (-) Transcript_922:173-1306(-)
MRAQVLRQQLACLCRFLTHRTLHPSPHAHPLPHTLPTTRSSTPPRGNLSCTLLPCRRRRRPCSSCCWHCPPPLHLLRAVVVHHDTRVAARLRVPPSNHGLSIGPISGSHSLEVLLLATLRHFLECHHAVRSRGGQSVAALARFERVLEAATLGWLVGVPHAGRDALVVVLPRPFVRAPVQALLGIRWTPVICTHACLFAGVRSKPRHARSARHRVVANRPVVVTATVLRVVEGDGTHAVGAGESVEAIPRLKHVAIPSWPCAVRIRGCFGHVGGRHGKVLRCATEEARMQVGECLVGRAEEVGGDVGQPLGTGAVVEPFHARTASLLGRQHTPLLVFAAVIGRVQRREAQALRQAALALGRGEAVEEVAAFRIRLQH